MHGAMLVLKNIYIYIYIDTQTCYNVYRTLNHLPVVFEVEIVVLRKLYCLWFEANTTRCMLFKVLGAGKTAETSAK